MASESDNGWASFATNQLVRNSFTLPEWGAQVGFQVPVISCSLNFSQCLMALSDNVRPSSSVTVSMQSFPY